MLDQYEAESKFKIQASSPSGINACSTFLVYVGKLSKQTEINTIRSHLSDIGVSNIDLADVIQLRCRNGNEASFCLSLHSAAAKNIVLSNKNWPELVRVRPFNRHSRYRQKPRHAFQKRHLPTYYSRKRDGGTQYRRQQYEDNSDNHCCLLLSMITKIMTLSTQKDGTLIGKTSLITAMKMDGITGHFSVLAIVMNNVMP